MLTGLTYRVIQITGVMVNGLRARKNAVSLALRYEWFINKMSQDYSVIMSCAIIYYYKANISLASTYRPFFLPIKTFLCPRLRLMLKLFPTA